MSKDLDEEDIVGDVLGFEHGATDGAVGGAEVALVSRVGQGSRRRRKRTWGDQSNLAPPGSGGFHPTSSRPGQRPGGAWPARARACQSIIDA
jgi:hypothetical protein